MNIVDNDDVRRKDRSRMAAVESFLDMDFVACLHRRNAALHLSYKNLHFLSFILMTLSSLSIVLREAEANSNIRLLFLPPLWLSTTIAEVETCDDTFDRLIISSRLIDSSCVLSAHCKMSFTKTPICIRIPTTTNHHQFT